MTLFELAKGQMYLPGVITCTQGSQIPVVANFHKMHMDSFSFKLKLAQKSPNVTRLRPDSLVGWPVRTVQQLAYILLTWK